jgi:heparin/heparan-sulfate lyase
MKAFERSFVFLNMKQADHPAVLIVFDRVVSSNPAFRKAWLLHGLEEPEIAGNRTLFKDSRKGYTGKLTVDTLLPVAADTEITKIGGPDQENRVDGVNYKALLRPDGVNESGGWRIEVSPKTARETDYFLHVLQVGDHKPDIAALPVNTIETETLAGLRLADRVVIFAKARDRSSGPVSFSFSGSGECQILVADLQSGTWMVERDGKPVCSTTVSADDGVAIFRGEAGAYRLVPKL